MQLLMTKSFILKIGRKQKYKRLKKKVAMPKKEDNRKIKASQDRKTIQRVIKNQILLIKNKAKIDKLIWTRSHRINLACFHKKNHPIKK